MSSDNISLEDGEDWMAREFGLSSDTVMSKPERTHPINDLPPEIFCHIFQIAQNLTGWPDDPKTSISWIRLTWVCRHWRHVALATPLLWNKILEHERDFNYSWVPAFLERAAGAQLDADAWLLGNGTIQGYTSRSSLVLRHLPPYTSSVRSFHMVVTAHSTSQSLEELLLHILPQLCSMESLRLHDHRTQATATTAFPQLTRDHLPRLHSIVLIGLCFPWTSSLYTSLRSLSVQWCKVPLPMPELIRILRSSPDLESLCLGHCLTLPPDPAHRLLPSILMPKLSSINIRGPRVTTDFVFDIISVPSLQTAEIEHDRLATESDTDIVKEAVPEQHILRPLLTQAKRLSLVNLIRGSLQLRLDEASDPAHDDDWAAHNPALLNMVSSRGRSVRTMTSVTPRVWAAILDALGNNAHRLTCLHLQLVHASFTDRDLWQRCFTRLPALEHLEVGSWSGIMPAGALEVILEMLQCSPDDSPTGSVRFYCPRLVVLGFNTVRVTAAGADALLSLLDRRTAHGVPLRHVVFTEPTCLVTFDAGGFSQQLLERVKVSTRCLLLLTCSIDNS
ncbi:hypothetical protein C8Q80DRAFT_916339 [Daedaleopsis nitida]|nr:hypothetical protein C8Q80DRAFT_916339 [Daedaleopsis nitida]